jgi:hypothetical protein
MKWQQVVDFSQDRFLFFIFFGTKEASLQCIKERKGTAARGRERFHSKTIVGRDSTPKPRSNHLDPLYT